MQPLDPSIPDSDRSILAVGALYAGLERGLAADAFSARALGCMAQTVCTSIVAAGHGRVTDVVEVPADTVDAQLEHIFETTTVDAAKVGIVGTADAARSIFRQLDRRLKGPFVLDVTISGPSGEDIADARAIDVFKEHLGRPDLVSIRRTDAELLTAMEIKSLDDAQVAVQRLHRLGARHVLLRTGRLPARFFEVENGAPDYVVDLYFDGEEFALFEGPYVDNMPAHGASSALLVAVTKNLSLRHTPTEAIQAAKAYVSEAIRRSKFGGGKYWIDFFWKQKNSSVDN